MQLLKRWEMTGDRVAKAKGEAKAELSYRALKTVILKGDRID